MMENILVCQRVGAEGRCNYKGIKERSFGGNDGTALYPDCGGGNVDFFMC